MNIQGSLVIFLGLAQLAAADMDQPQASEALGLAQAVADLAVYPQGVHVVLLRLLQLAAVPIDDAQGAERDGARRGCVLGIGNAVGEAQRHLAVSLSIVVAANRQIAIAT
jgi:hypothetical protein